MADYSGRQLGNYQLIRLLGQGGFAQVYLGKHVHLDKRAAIKLLHTQLGGSDVKSFRKEARRVSSLEHQHIVGILDFGVEGTMPFLVMTYAPKGTLRQRYPRGTLLPLSTVMSYVKQVASALQFAHNKNIIHRDVKPENMLIGRNNEILLGDFGIAVNTYSLTTQLGIGTIDYMAPEQSQGKASFASDQYSLGITVYEWLCGMPPFIGAAKEIYIQHLMSPPPPLREKVSTLPQSVEDVVLRALSKEPQKRFASVQEFADALGWSCQQHLAQGARNVPIGKDITQRSIYSQGGWGIPQTVPLSTPTPPFFMENPTTADLEAISKSNKNAYIPSMQRLILDGDPAKIWKRLRRNNNEYAWATNPSDEMANVQFTEQPLELTNFTFQAKLEFPDHTAWAVVFRLHNQDRGYFLNLTNIRSSSITYLLKTIEVHRVILSRKLVLFNHHSFAPDAPRIAVPLGFISRSVEAEDYTFRHGKAGVELAQGEIRWTPKEMRFFNRAVFHLLLGTVVQDNTIDLYGNLHHLVRICDTTASSGELCLYSSENNSAHCTRATVWTP